MAKAKPVRPVKMYAFAENGKILKQIDGTLDLHWRKKSMLAMLRDFNDIGMGGDDIEVIPVLVTPLPRRKP